MRKSEVIEAGGRRIAVALIETIGTENGGEDNLYMEAPGQYWLVRGMQARGVSLQGKNGYSFPRDAARYNRDTGKTERTIRLSERGVLEWFVQEWINDTPIKTLLKECVAAFVPKAERKGKRRLETWVRVSVAKGVAREARRSGRSVPEQLELLACESVSRLPRPKGAKKGAPEPGHVQLELATALVCTCARLASKPSPETLAEARREVSTLHRDLHSDDAFRRAAI
jgi:hypothetical protein